MPDYKSIVPFCTYYSMKVLKRIILSKYRYKAKDGRYEILKSDSAKRLFCLYDIEKMTGNRNTAKSILQEYKKAGYIASVRRDLHAAIDLASQHALAGRYEIGSAMNKEACISHHGALEYHGIANQVFYTMAVSSPERFSSFTFGGITYERVLPKIAGGVLSSYSMPLVKVTDMERAVVDCIYDIERAGGLDEIIEALRLIPQLDEGKLLDYLEEYNQIYLWQKAGIILSHFKEELSLDERFFSVCKSHINDRKKISACRCGASLL